MDDENVRPTSFQRSREANNKDTQDHGNEIKLPTPSLGHGLIYVPSALSWLQPAQTLIVNDAPWLSEELRSKGNNTNVVFCHPLVPIPSALALGVRSLRKTLLQDLDQCPLKCPTPERIRTRLGIPDPELLPHVAHEDFHNKRHMVELLGDICELVSLIGWLHTHQPTISILNFRERDIH